MRTLLSDQRANTNSLNTLYIADVPSPLYSYLLWSGHQPLTSRLKDARENLGLWPRPDRTLTSPHTQVVVSRCSVLVTGNSNPGHLTHHISPQPPAKMCACLQELKGYEDEEWTWTVCIHYAMIVWNVFESEIRYPSQHFRPRYWDKFCNVPTTNWKPYPV